MINLLLGGPGGGKSYEAVVFHVLPALKRGRKVITNLPLNVEELEAVEPGCSALIEIRTGTLAVAPELSDSAEAGVMGLINQARAAKFVSRPFANPEDYESEWRHVEGMGPLFVIDECHFALPRGGTSRAVEEWYSMHRHFNVDVLLITQSSGKISAAIKDLVQVCYKVRKAVALGKPNGYIRKVLDGVNGGEVSTSERKYLPQMFKLYRSHTQGMPLDEQLADDVAPLATKVKRFTWAWALVTVAVCAWAFWPQGDKVVKVAKVEKSPAWLPAAAAEYQANPPPDSDLAKSRVSSPVVSTPAIVLPGQGSEPDSNSLEPFKNKLISLTGWARMGDKEIFTFVVSSSGNRLFELRLPEVIKAGYSFKSLGECSGVLTWGNNARAVICDAPQVAYGGNNTPVVIANGTSSVASPSF